MSRLIPYYLAARGHAAGRTVACRPLILAVFIKHISIDMCIPVNESLYTYFESTMPCHIPRPEK